MMASARSGTARRRAEPPGIGALVPGADADIAHSLDWVAQAQGASAQISLPRQTLGEVAYSRIRDAVLTTAMRPGTAMSEVELAAAIGVSRTPVREAIRRLAEEGLFEVTAQQGTRVSRISMQRVRQAVFIRRVVEVAALRRAESWDDSALAPLRVDIARHEAALASGNLLLMYREDEAFHHDLMAVAGLPLASDALHVVAADVTRIQFLMGVDGDYYPSVLRDHRRLVELLAGGRIADAAELLGRHIEGFIYDQEHLLRAHSDFFVA